VTASIERALAKAERDPTGAVRELLLELFDGKRIEKSLVDLLSVIAEHATALRTGLAPAEGQAAEPLGDNWFQCPHCADAFEGERGACPACEQPLALARPALELLLGDGARLWLRTVTGNRPSRLEIAKVEWLRVEAGPRWFELFDARGRMAAAIALTQNGAIPPNVTPIGARDGRTLIVHETKLDVFEVNDGKLRPTGERMGGTELAVAQLAGVLFPDGVPAAPSGKALASRGHVREPRLEAAIMAEPDRPDAYLVYADWLQAKGDPRGELIVLQHAGKAFEAGRLLDAQAPHLFGRLADYRHQLEPSHSAARGRPTTWRWGFLEALWIGNKRDVPTLEVDEALAAMLDHPSAAVLRELAVGIVSFDGNSYDEIAAVIGERSLPTLRKLILGDFYPGDTELNWSELGDLSPMYRAMPGLTSLLLRSGSMTLGDLELPALEELTIITGGLDAGSLASICDRTWPHLRTLDLQLGDETAFTTDHLAAIFDAARFPAVTTLGLGNSAISDDIARALAGSKIAAQLVGLKLSRGTLGDAGARALAAGAFPKLAWIDVSESWLTDDGIAALQTIAKEVDVDSQEDDEGDPENRYIAGRE
jgi:uncharacterized protein (TIGR02996 family)